MDKRKFLIVSVDDNPGDTLLINRALLESGFNSDFQSFETGRAFLTYIYNCEISPSLIILDINIPIINGFELLNILSKDPFMARIPKIVLSSSSNPNDVFDSYLLGANCFAMKPLSYVQLKALIAYIINFCFNPLPFPYNRIKYVPLNISHRR